MNNDKIKQEIKLKIYYHIESLCLLIDELYDIKKLFSATAVVNVKER